MPPDHMAAVVRIILDDAELRADWRSELDEMCGRIRQLRARLAVYDPRLAYHRGPERHVLDAAALARRR